MFAFLWFGFFSHIRIRVSKRFSLLPSRYFLTSAMNLDGSAWYRALLYFEKQERHFDWCPSLLFRFLLNSEIGFSRPHSQQIFVCSMRIRP